MPVASLIGILGRNDLRLIGRDRFLLSMLGFAVLIALVLRYLLPALNDHLAAAAVMPGPSIPFSVAAIYPMIVAYLGLFTGAVLVGTLFGFVLLDERDQQTLSAMRTTPVPLSHYVLYRVGGPALLAVVVVAGMTLVIDQALPSWWQLLALSAGAALTAPIAALFYATVADNKLQGLAYSKFTSISGWVIIGGWFVDVPWQWLLGLFPPFWISKAYWLALNGDPAWWLVLGVGVILQLAVIHWLIRRFNRVVAN